MLWDCPDALGVGVAEIPISMTVFCLGRLRLIGYFARADFAPDLFVLAGYGTQRATLKASPCIKAVEAKVAY